MSGFLNRLWAALRDNIPVRAKHFVHLEQKLQELLDNQHAQFAAAAAMRDQLNRQLLREVTRARMEDRRVLSACLRREQQAETTPLPAPCQALDPKRALEKGIARLRASYPQATRVWESLLVSNEKEYRQSPCSSCSVEGHGAARVFGGFLAPYLTGRVLDIGCGPQSLPNYLSGYPAELISGIDPLAPFEGHPFEFVRAIAEYLPWPDNTFDVAIIGTSLDHVVSLDLTYQEVIRTLKSGGVFIAWLGVIEGSKPYDPAASTIQPVDQYHLFHLDRQGFEESIAPYFGIDEWVDLDGVSHFYCLRPHGQALARAA